MTLNSKQLQALKKAEKRRLRRPEPEIVDWTALVVKPRERSRFTERAPRVLLAVEKALTHCAHDNSAMDDSHVAAALVCAIRDTPHESEAISQLLVQLEIAASESGAEREDWRTALRVIYTSVVTQSDCKRGSRQYLHFATNFVSQASPSLHLSRTSKG